MSDEKSWLSILGELPGDPQDELPRPLVLLEIAKLRFEAGFPSKSSISHKFIKDGIYTNGINISNSEELDFVKLILKKILKETDSVKDEHFKNIGLVGAGFLRSIDIGYSVKSTDFFNIVGQKKASKLLIRLFFRFTTDYCPAGCRMMAEVEKQIKRLLTNQFYFKENSFDLHCVHGGTPWSVDDMNDEYQKEILKQLISSIH